VSTSATQLREALRQALVEQNAAHEPVFYMAMKEAEALDLASGYVPTPVQAMARAMLDWQEQDRRRAARPYRAKPKRKGRRDTTAKARRKR